MHDERDYEYGFYDTTMQSKHKILSIIYFIRI